MLSLDCFLSCSCVVVMIQLVETLSEFQMLGKIESALIVSPFSMCRCHWALSSGAMGKVAHQGRSSSLNVASDMLEFGRTVTSDTVEALLGKRYT